MYIDAHCHLADPRFQGGELDQVLARSREAGVSRWIQGGVDPADWTRQERLAARYPGAIIPCFGLHPWWVAEKSAAEFDQAFEALTLRAAQAVGLGEFGLDFHPKLDCYPNHRVKQLAAFEAQLGLAVRLDKPIVLHIVKAHDDALSILKRVGVPSPGGLVHAFSASPGVAARYLSLGLTLSVSGIVTRKGFESLKRTVVSVPLGSLVLETDSPDQRPALSNSLGDAPGGPLPACSGENPEELPEELNEPSNLLPVAQAVGRLRGESPARILEQSTENLIRIFGLKK